MSDTNDATVDAAAGSVDDPVENDSQDGVNDDLGDEARKEIQKKNNEAKNLRARAKEAEAKVSDLEARLFAVENAGATAEDLLKNLQKENDALKSQISETNKAAMRADVARRFSIPDELADRIQGDDLDEMEEDAKTLAKFGEKKVRKTENQALGRIGQGEKSSADLFAEILGA